MNRKKGDVRSMWRVLNMALGSKLKTTNFNTISVKGREISDPKEIANALNSHFCTKVNEFGSNQHNHRLKIQQM